MFPLTRPWAWAFLVIGLIGLPIAAALALRLPNAQGYVNVACSLGFIAIGVYRVIRPISSR